MKHSNLELTRLLFKYGANRKILDDEQRTLFHLLIYHDKPSTEVAKLLIEKGVDIFAKDKNVKK